MVFWPKLQYFLAKLNFNFLLHNFSRYVIYGFPTIFSMKGSWRYGSDKGSVTHGYPDGRTYTEGRTICLPQGEIYNYMSPPAGDIYCSYLGVCPSVRPSVRPCVTLACPSHISKNLPCKIFAKNSKNNIPTEVVQQKIKILFCQKFGSFGQKPLFEFGFCPGQISVTVEDKDTGFFCSVSKNISIVQRQSQICKMSIFDRF